MQIPKLKEQQKNPPKIMPIFAWLKKNVSKDKEMTKVYRFNGMMWDGNGS